MKPWYVSGRSDTSGINVRLTAADNRAGSTPDPEQKFALIESAKFQSEGDIREWVVRNRTSKRRVLIYVHGFNTSHRQAVVRMAQIVHDGNIAAAPVLFSWPSRGGPFFDRADRSAGAGPGDRRK